MNFWRTQVKVEAEGGGAPWENYKLQNTNHKKKSRPSGTRRIAYKEFKRLRRKVLLGLCVLCALCGRKDRRYNVDAFKGEIKGRSIKFNFPGHDEGEPGPFDSIST
jgi:hypothetical protein